VFYTFFDAERHGIHGSNAALLKRSAIPTVLGVFITYEQYLLKEK